MAGIDPVTGRALTGHVTEEMMRRHYSTVRLDEKRAAMEAVAQRFREAKVGTLVGTTPKRRKPPLDGLTSKQPDFSGLQRAGDRARTGDNLLGKQVLTN